MERQPSQRDFSVPYGLASVSVVTTVAAVIATTQANYHGLAVIAGSTKCTVTIYDNASTITGRIVDLVQVAASGNVWIDRYIPIIAKSGMCAICVGTGATVVVFFGPKG